MIIGFVWNCTCFQTRFVIYLFIKDDNISLFHIFIKNETKINKVEKKTCCGHSPYPDSCSWKIYWTNRNAPCSHVPSLNLMFEDMCIFNNFFFCSLPITTIISISDSFTNLIDHWVQVGISSGIKCICKVYPLPIFTSVVSELRIRINWKNPLLVLQATWQLAFYTILSLKASSVMLKKSISKWLMPKQVQFVNLHVHLKIQ